MCCTDLLDTNKDRHDSFPQLRGTVFKIILFVSGNSDDPQLGDVNIQFHASHVLSNVFMGLGGRIIPTWKRNYYLKEALFG